MVVNLETRDQGRLLDYYFAKCQWLGSVDKSAIISTWWWTNSHNRAHSKMDSRYFVSEVQCSSHTPRINNTALNFETKEQRKVFDNLYLESIDKSAIISTQGWTNSHGTVHSKMDCPTFVNEVVYILRNIIIDNDRHWHNRAKETIHKYVTVAALEAHFFKKSPFGNL